MYAPDGDSATVVMQVPFAQSKSFLAQVLGYTRKVGNALSRTTPMQHSDRLDWLYATDAEWLEHQSEHGEDASSRLTFDGNVKYAVHFKSLPYKVLDDPGLGAVHSDGELGRYVERLDTFAVENLQVPGGAYRWVTAPQDAIQEPPARIFVTRQVSYIWHQIPQSALSAVKRKVDACIGRVNSTTFDREVEPVAGTFGYPAETLLLVGADFQLEKERCCHPNPPERMWRVTYQMLYRNNGSSGGTYFGHNHLYRASAGTFQRVELASAAGTYLYSLADFNTLFNLA